MHLYTYRVQSLQELRLVYYPRGLRFCQWYLNYIAIANEIVEKTLFTDKAWFHLSGYTNSQMRLWATDHRHAIVEESVYPEELGVCAAISKRTLNAERYQNQIFTPFILELPEGELK